jgi:hypothetical protein
VRVNVYSQELTDEVRRVSKESDGRVVTGVLCLPNGEPMPGRSREVLPQYLVEIWEKSGRPDFVDATNPYRNVREELVVYHAAQLVLHSSPMLHHPPFDDDRSAITFWLPKSKERREAMARAFEAIAEIFRNSPAGSGLD